jgi:hypothetical protein
MDKHDKNINKNLKINMNMGTYTDILRRYGHERVTYLGTYIDLDTETDRNMDVAI